MSANTGGAAAIDVEADIGRKAIAFVAARRARMAARRARTAAAVSFYDAHGSDAAYSEVSEHPRGFSQPFLDATGDQQRAYEAALAAEKSSRQKLYAAVRKAARREAK